MKKLVFFLIVIYIVNVYTDVDLKDIYSESIDKAILLGENIDLIKEGILQDKYTIKSNENKFDANSNLNNVETIVQSSTTNSQIDNFCNIKLGTSEDEVISLIGNPSRVDLSEYGFNWYVYNQYKNKFAMVGIENGKVVALYTNSLQSNLMKTINFSKDRTYILSNYKPLEYKKKGYTKFIISSKGEYDVLEFRDMYITVFYDIYNSYKITSYQIIDKNTEDKSKDIYPQYSKALRDSFEREVIDLTNSVRDKYNLSRVKYDDKAQISSRKHSLDMKQNNFFDHINLRGQDPFDRMKTENIDYKSAGENIAAGQTSAIFAHEAWMNSEGHRKNILNNYEKLGVGVEFGGNYKIYYTQNFYTGLR
jgi:uncharacterized protein YkwD